MSDTTTPQKKKEPTASEAMFFFAIVKHTRNKADIDWNAVALEQNFKNAEVAKVRFGQVKRKLGINSDSPVPGPVSRSTPKKGSSAATPTKVKKMPTTRVGTKGRQNKVKKEEPSAEDYDDEELMDDSTVVKGEENELHVQITAEMDAILNEEDPF